METSAACWVISEADVSRKPLAIDAGTLVTPERQFSPGRLLIDGTTIMSVGSPDSIQVPLNAAHIDASKLLVTPGFVDPHIHGCCGVDVMEGTHDSLNTVSRILVRHGTTSFLPTTVSSPPDVLKLTAEKLGAAMAKPFDGAQPLGIHLEGPFISVEKRGTHRATNVLPPDPNLLAEWVLASGNTVKLLTLAPELNGFEPLLIMAQHYGLTIAMGHSNATFAEAKAAADRGVHYAVHAFNAMRAFAHRDPGIVGEVLVDDRLFAEIIADGIHVDEAAVRVFARAKGSSRVLLVTDAVSATDMPDGQYALGGDTVEVVNGVCRNAEGRLAGSTLTQEIALRNFIEWTHWPLEDALACLTSNPARALKLQRKGILEPGADADVVIMDEQFRVIKTLVAGRVVFERL
jgi:N-acetylglucosamine-6-phosphate deacetylase